MDKASRSKHRARRAAHPVRFLIQEVFRQTLSASLRSLWK